MRRFFIILLAIAFIFSLCAVPVSAASYDLGQPYYLIYITPTTADPSSFRYSSGYTYDSDTDTLNFRIGYFDNWQFGYATDYHLSPSFGVSSWDFLFRNNGDVSSIVRHITVAGFDSSKPALLYQNSGDVRNSLLFEGIVFENLYLPQSGQYLRISLSFSTALINMPEPFKRLVSANDLCFLCDTSGVAGVAGRYSYPKVSAQTVTVSRNQNAYTYTFYFNLNRSNLGPLVNSDNICLGIRVPYYFNNTASFQDGIWLLSNAEIPSTYEIITIGGYDQDLKSIENAIVTSNQTLVDLYTNESDEDLTYVIQLENSNSQLDQGIKDYQSAAAPVEQIRDQFTAPPLKDLVNDNLDELQTAEVKDLFSLPWLISAIGIVFSFAIIRVILYGTKE